MRGLMGPRGLMRLMGPMRLIGPMGLMGLIGVISLMGLMGCGSEADEEPVVTPPVAKFMPQFASYVTWFDEVQRGSEGTRAESYEAYESYGSYGTRAWSVPSGYEPYEDGIQPIGIAFTQNNQALKIGNFFYSSSKWKTNLDDISAGTYYLYGYIPHQTAITFSVTDRDGANASYSTGAKVVLSNVPTVMSNDLCVVIGAKEGTDKETVTGLRRGDFGISAEPVTIVESDPKNFVFLLFDHLYASLSVNLKVYADYDALRTIKLKSLQLSTQADEETSKDHNTITIDLAATDGSTSPIQAISYEQTGKVIGTADDDKDGIEFWKSAAGTTLTTGYQTFNSYFMPTGINTLVLTSVYDVYDKKGNKVRENCKATNTMILEELFTEQTETERGKRYKINMTINPTYLYVLSEPDLNSPTVSLE